MRCDRRQAPSAACAIHEQQRNAERNDPEHDPRQQDVARNPGHGIAEQQHEDPIPNLAPGRAARQIGPVQFVKVRANSLLEGARLDALPRRYPAQFQRAGSKIRLAPDLGGVGKAGVGKFGLGFPDRADKAQPKSGGTAARMARRSQSSLQAGN